MKLFRIFTTLILTIIAVIVFTPSAWAFCGFYVSQADTKLYNKASQVVIAKDGKRTILTMANDYQGEVKDFAIVVPVPVILQKEQVHIGESKILERLDAFSAPRLVEYFDENPCADYSRSHGENLYQSTSTPEMKKERQEVKTLGVTVEAQFTVGEYDILILSAKESNGLETWLKQNNYKIPQGANQLLQPYIRQNMKFFVAKVNLDEFNKSGAKFLRPLQMAYESPKFMLPIRLGMINAKTEQDLIVYILSPKGQAELTNYRMVNVPSDAEIPEFIKNEFGDFYKYMFENAYSHEGKKVGFLEYAWNMNSCDPCAAEPLNTEELKKAGVFWLNPEAYNNGWIDTQSNVFMTRLHVRYSRDKFPEDLMFQETSNQQTFQGRYILRHPFKGNLECNAGQQYKRSLPKRFEQQSQTLSKLTGWKIQDIRKKMEISETDSWWQNSWK